MKLLTPDRAYLPGAGVNGDQGGRSPGWRLGHCTPVRLKPASSPNRWTSGAEFVVVGVAFALPSLKIKGKRVLVLGCTYPGAWVIRPHAIPLRGRVLFWYSPHWSQTSINLRPARCRTISSLKSWCDSRCRRISQSHYCLHRSTYLSIR